MSPDFFVSRCNKSETSEPSMEGPIVFAGERAELTSMFITATLY